MRNKFVWAVPPKGLSIKPNTITKEFEGILYALFEVDEDGSSPFYPVLVNDPQSIYDKVEWLELVNKKLMKDIRSLKGHDSEE